MIYQGTFSKNGSGNKTVALLPFAPKALRFKILKPGTPDSNIVFLAGGYTDGSTSNGFAIINNSGAITTYEDGAKCLLGYDVVGGVNTKVLEATFVSFGSSSFTLNFTAADATYQIQVDILG